MLDTKYTIAAFPIFNKKNFLVYNLMYCSSNKKWFGLYNKSSWKILSGKSSAKDTHGNENQLVLCFEDYSDPKTITDEYWLYFIDVAAYLHNKFSGLSDMPFYTIIYSSLNF